MFSDTFKDIDELFFLGKAIDALPDSFVIGIKDVVTKEGNSYERGEGKKLEEDLKQLDTDTLIYIICEYMPPSAIAQSIASEGSAMQARQEIGIIHYNPNEEIPLFALEVPDEMITEPHQAKENAFALMEWIQLEANAVRKTMDA